MIIVNKKDNCFSLIRLFVSLTVVYQHARLSGMDLPNIKFINWIDKVPIFFMISAYSIMLSLDNKQVSFKEFSIKRFLRLYPELWIAIILEILIFIVQYPNLLSNISFYLWIFAQLTFFQFWTPECLRFYGNGTPNGSLWTNIVFIQFYVIIYYLSNKIKKLSISKDIVVLLFLICVNSGISLLEGSINEILYKLTLQTLLPYLYMFYFGIILYKYSDKLIPICKKYFWMIFIIFVLASEFNYITNFIPHTSNTGTVIHVLVCCFFFFAFAFKFNNLKLKNDYSYGIYIFHMPIINYFIQNKTFSSDYLCLIVAYIITIILSLISNKLSKKIIKKLTIV